MEHIKVNVKWGKESLSADIDLKKDLLAFKKHLQSLTTVPVEKQKVLFKGKVLKVVSCKDLIAHR